MPNTWDSMRADLERRTGQRWPTMQQPESPQWGALKGCYSLWRLSREYGNPPKHVRRALRRAVYWSALEWGWPFLLIAAAVMLLAVVIIFQRGGK